MSRYNEVKELAEDRKECRRHRQEHGSSIRRILRNTCETIFDTSIDDIKTNYIFYFPFYMTVTVSLISFMFFTLYISHSRRKLASTDGHRSDPFLFNYAIMKNQKRTVSGIKTIIV